MSTEPTADSALPTTRNRAAALLLAKLEGLSRLFGILRTEPHLSTVDLDSLVTLARTVTGHPLAEDETEPWALICDVLYGELREPMTLEDAQRGRDRLTRAHVEHLKALVRRRRSAR